MPDNGNSQIVTQNIDPKAQSLTAMEIRNQVTLIQEVMRDVMQGPTKENPNGVHYGTVPGCGDKLVLLKPGAEKLSLTFRLRPIIDNDRDVRVDHFEGAHREVRVYCHVKNMSGEELATGVGSCSTMESKYRYRGGIKISTGRPVPKEFWNLKNEGKIREAQDLIGGKGFGTMKGDSGWEICELGEKMENPDIADTYNTVLKMAKKRAYIDGILSATAASDIFTQDLEEIEPEAVVATAEAPQASPAMPTRKSEAAPAATTATAPVDRSAMKPMTAKFPGKCGECGEVIIKDEMIFYHPDTKKTYHHPACAYVPE